MKINVKNRTIFCHDNLDILRGINSNSVDLIYIDPPFNKKKMFIAPTGSSAEGASFKDWFEEKEIKEEWLDSIEQDNPSLHNFLNGIKAMDGRKSYNFCYLAYMAIRLIEMRRVLKPSGSIYLHCDATMSHYLKLVMDCIFGEKKFQNEIVWYYYNKFSKGTKIFAKNYDQIFFYSKNTNYYFNPLRELRRTPIKQLVRENVNGVLKNKKNAEGKVIYRIVHDKKIDAVWKISCLQNASKEYVGYPTQKPVVLLERIIKASCPEDGIVLDPFCGCATTCVAAEKLSRKWIGIDISLKAYELVKKRLKKELEQKNIFEKPWNNITYLTYPLKRTDRNGDKEAKKWIYIISNPKYPGEYKVGVAKNPSSRLNSYQTSDPDRKYKIEYKVETFYFNKIEKAVHNFFPNKHEWVQASLHKIKNKINELIDNFKQDF